MDELIKEFIDYLRFQRNYSNNTEANYLIDLEEYEEYIHQHRINYLNITYHQINQYTK